MGGRKRFGIIALVAALAIIGSAAILFGIDHSTLVRARASAVSPSISPDSDSSGSAGVERTFGSPRRSSFL